VRDRAVVMASLVLGASSPRRRCCRSWYGGSPTRSDCSPGIFPDIRSIRNGSRIGWYPGSG